MELPGSIERIFMGEMREDRHAIGLKSKLHEAALKEEDGDLTKLFFLDESLVSSLMCGSTLQGCTFFNQ